MKKPIKVPDKSILDLFVTDEEVKELQKKLKEQEIIIKKF